MQKIYYDKIQNKQIVDLSGKKSLAQIKEEFGDADYQVLKLDENKDGHKVENGKLKKYNLEEERQQAEAKAEAKRQLRKNKLKTKLNFTDEQIDILRDAIREGI